MSDAGSTNERPTLDLPEYLRPFAVVALFVAAMWAVEILDHLPHTHFDRWGIEPRHLVGLRGIVFGPFLHTGFRHLISNTIPFLVLGSVIAVGGVKRYLQVTGLIALLGGGALWLLGPGHTIEVGASGVVFGYLGYLIARGFFDRNVLYLAVGAVVAFVYAGTILWGVVPHFGISWQGHVLGAAAGVATARIVYPKKRRPTPGPAPDAPTTMPPGITT